MKIVERFNIEKGYSYTSERRVAEELKCSQAAVHKAIQWWLAEGAIIRVDEPKANHVAKYAICLPDDHSYESNQADSTHGGNRNDSSYVGNNFDSAHRGNHNGKDGTKVKSKEFRPAGSGSRTSGAPPSHGRIDINKTLDYLRR